MSRHSLGIDIGNEKLTLVFLKGTGKKVHLAAWATYALDKDRAHNERLAGIADLVSDFMAESRIGSTCAFLGIPAESAVVREIGFPAAVRENLGTTLTYEMEKYIPVPAENLYFDYQILDEDKKANRLRVLLVAAKKKTLMPYLEVANTIGNIFAVEPGSEALANFLAFGKNGKMSVSELIDSLKSEPERTVFEAAAAKANLPSEEYARAFGLALQGIWDTPVRINLLPPDLRKKPSRTGRYLMIVLSILAVLAILAWGGAAMLRQRIELSELMARNTSLSAEIPDYDRTLESIGELEARLAYLNALRTDHVPVSDILRELSLIIPVSAWVRDFRLEKNEIHLTGEAEIASELIPVLETSPLFREAHFSSPITKARNGREKFKIGLKLHSKSDE